MFVKNFPSCLFLNVPCIGCQNDGISTDHAGNGGARFEGVGAGRRRREGGRREGVGRRRGRKQAGGAAATAKHGGGGGCG